MEELNLEHLEAELNEDPNIQAALTEHNAACEDDEDHCVVCQTKKALSSLMWVRQAINDDVCDCESCQETGQSVSELDIAYTLATDLETALFVVSACQQAIQTLSEIAQATAFVIAENELHSDHDHDHEEE